MPLIELSKYESFSKEKPISKLLYDSENIRLVLFSLEAGQKIESHTVEPQVSMLVVSGKGKLIIGDKKVDVKQGYLGVCESMESHGFEADEKMVVLASITPSPK
jgi:quercetin dioxygenase-like cupin family protein